MKKLLKITLVMLTVLLLGASLTGVKAEGTNAGIQEGKFEDGFYYCLAPDRSQYQLSETQLNASTEELINAVLDYPYIVDLLTNSGRCNNAYDNLKAMFNGIAELEKRADAATIMLDMLANSAENRSDFRPYLRCLLSLPVYADQLTTNQWDMCLQMCGLDSLCASISLEGVVSNAAENSKSGSEETIVFFE